MFLLDSVFSQGNYEFPFFHAFLLKPRKILCKWQKPHKTKENQTSKCQLIWFQNLELHLCRS